MLSVVCITFLSLVSFLHHLWVVLFMAWTLADGCVCTAVIDSVSYLCIYCVAVYVYMFNMLMSGIPNKACLFPETTNNLHIFCLLLCCVFTLYMPYCLTVVLLYVFNWMFLFLVAANCSSVAIGNNLLYLWKGITCSITACFSLIWYYYWNLVWWFFF